MGMCMELCEGASYLASVRSANNRPNYCAIQCGNHGDLVQITYN